jgi:hypothetical protein
MNRFLRIVDEDPLKGETEKGEQADRYLYDRPASSGVSCCHRE